MGVPPDLRTASKRPAYTMYPTYTMYHQLYVPAYNTYLPIKCTAYYTYLPMLRICLQSISAYKTYRIEMYRLQYVSRSPDIRVKPCYEQYDMPTRTIISSTDHMRMASHQRFLPCVVSSKYYMRISGNYHFTQIT